MPCAEKPATSYALTTGVGALQCYVLEDEEMWKSTCGPSHNEHFYAVDNSSSSSSSYVVGAFSFNFLPINLEIGR
ncbi:hypothetical protein M514_09536, partial [Trichuris suis]